MFVSYFYFNIIILLLNFIFNLLLNIWLFISEKILISWVFLKDYYNSITYIELITFICCLLCRSFLYLILRIIINWVFFIIYKYFIQSIYSYLSISNKFQKLFNYIFFMLLFISIFLLFDFLNISIIKHVHCEPIRDPIVVNFISNDKTMIVSGSFVNYLYYSFGAKTAFITASKTAGFIMREIDSTSLASTSQVTDRDLVASERGLFISKTSENETGFKVGFSITKLAPRSNREQWGNDIVLLLADTTEILKANLPKMPDNNKVWKFIIEDNTVKDITVKHLKHNAFYENSTILKPLNSVYDQHKQYWPDGKITVRWKWTSDKPCSKENSVLNAIIENGLNSF